MDDKYRQLIEDMAAKLGVTSEHLWGVLVKQAPISGAVALVQCIVITAATALFFNLVMRKTKLRSNSRGYQYAEWEGQDAVTAWISALIVGTVYLIFIFVSSREIAGAFLNPEYWALQQLLQP